MYFIFIISLEGVCVGVGGWSLTAFFFFTATYTHLECDSIICGVECKPAAAERRSKGPSFIMLH